MLLLRQTSNTFCDFRINKMHDIVADQDFASSDFRTKHGIVCISLGEQPASDDAHTMVSRWAQGT